MIRVYLDPLYLTLAVLRIACFLGDPHQRPLFPVAALVVATLQLARAWTIARRHA